MKYYLIPINETRVYFLNERLKDLLYEKYPEVGALEINKTTVKLIGNEKKHKIIAKIDKKLENYLDKNNIPKYLICYRFPKGDIHEIETNMDVYFKDELDDNLYLVSYDEAQDYFFRSIYDERINTFINKESVLNEEVKVDKDVKKKTKKKTKEKKKTVSK